MFLPFRLISINLVVFKITNKNVDNKNLNESKCIGFNIVNPSLVKKKESPKIIDIKVPIKIGKYAF